MAVLEVFRKVKHGNSNLLLPSHLQKEELSTFGFATSTHEYQLGIPIEIPEAATFLPKLAFFLLGLVAQTCH